MERPGATGKNRNRNPDLASNENPFILCGIEFQKRPGQGPRTENWPHPPRGEGHSPEHAVDRNFLKQIDPRTGA